MRFENWCPKEGERAVVPGGPACRRYVAELTKEECDAIISGKVKTYAPIRISVIDNGDVLDTLIYSERYNVWLNNLSGKAKSPSAFLRAARVYYKRPNAVLSVG